MYFCSRTGSNVDCASVFVVVHFQESEYERFAFVVKSFYENKMFVYKCSCEGFYIGRISLLKILLATSVKYKSCILLSLKTLSFIKYL